MVPVDVLSAIWRRRQTTTSFSNVLSLNKSGMTLLSFYLFNILTSSLWIHLCGCSVCLVGAKDSPAHSSHHHMVTLEVAESNFFWGLFFICQICSIFHHCSLSSNQLNGAMDFVSFWKCCEHVHITWW